MVTTSGDKYAFDLKQIVAESFVDQIRYLENVASTNNAALELCRGDDLQSPLLVLASEQTAGRGRGSNQWWSPRGALTFSLVMRPADLGLVQRSWPKLSLTTGLGVCLALRELLPNDDVLLKWPNDVCLRDRKLSGVLVEVGPRQTEMLVIGIGVNVNNSVQTAPDELRSIATSIVDVTGYEVRLNDVLACMLRHLETQFTRLSRHDPELAEDWQRHCALIGRSIEVDTGVGGTTGVCQGIDEDGALVILTEQGATRLFGGAVTRIA